MAEVKRFPLVRHIRSDNGFHLLYFKNGKLVQSGRGLSFWFLPLSASMAEVPVVDQIISFGFSLKTADFQDVSIQGAVNWRVADPSKMAERVDFSIDLARGVYLKQPLETLATQFVQLAQQHADTYVSTAPLKELLQRGLERLRELLTLKLSEAKELADAGATVVSVRVTAIHPKPEVEKAMEAPVRERIQQEADEAAFSRRAMAVEKERAIKENELKNQIELAKRDEELIAQKGQNERRQATEKGEALRISSEATAKQVGIQTASQALTMQAMGKAEAEKIQLVEGASVAVERQRLAAQLEWEQGRVNALKSAPAHVLYGMAAQQLAGKLETIEHLSLSPDFLSPLLSRLVDAGTKKLEASDARGMSSTPRIVVVTRPTEFELLLERHGTAEQAAFFLKTRGQTLEPVRARHESFGKVLTAVSQAIPVEWRRTAVQRQDLSRFVFEPDDVVVAVGQDGLVPNVAKYLDGQPVVGVNPAPDQVPGVLVRHRAETVEKVLASLHGKWVRLQERTMVEVTLDDGQKLLALNEAFVGHVSHQSARYRIRFRGKEERQSSSGLIVATGTGATGWSKSIVQERAQALDLPKPGSPSLAFLVREAFPSLGLGTDLVQGIIEGEDTLEIVCEQESGATVFGDGIEEDRLEPRWGQSLQVRVSPKRLRLVV